MASDLLQGLRGDLGMRRIGSGMARLDEYWAKTGRLDPNDPDAPGLLCYIAQWVDAGWRDVDVVQDGLGAFPKGRRTRLPLVDYAYVLMAEGMIWVAEENVERALANFSLVLSLRDRNRRPGFCSRWRISGVRAATAKPANMTAPCITPAEGYRYASEAGMEPMAAAMRVAESWLLFQKGRIKEALKLLGEADAVLRQTDDYITRGNIQSSYGRMYRREGRYDLALRHFSQAIEEYRSAIRNTAIWRGLSPIWDTSSG